MSATAELSTSVFEVSEAHHHNDFNEVALSQVLKMLSGFAFQSESFTNDGNDGLPLIRIRDLGNANTVCRYVGSYDENFVVNNGDILVGMDGEFAAIRWQGGPALLNQRVLKLSSAMPDVLDDGFLFYRVQPTLAELEMSISGTTVKHLSTKDLKRLVWNVPPLHEQRRIAEVLLSVDVALSSAELVLEQCEKVLRVELDSVIGGLLSDDTQKIKLGDVARVKGGKRLPKGSAYSDEPTSNPYVRVTDWRDYEIRTNCIRYISDDIARSIWRYTISASDIFISIAGSIGLVASVPDKLDGAYLTENAAKISIIDPNTLVKAYLLAVLRSRPLVEQIRRHKGVGGGVPKLALFRIEDLDIPVPPLSMQAEIADSYLSLLESCETASRVVDQLVVARDAIRSDLLSGRVRVPA